MRNGPFVVVDVETVAVTVNPLDLASFRNGWKPPANYKDPDKIDARRREAEGEFVSERALTVEGAKPISIAVGTIENNGCLSNEAVAAGDGPELANFLFDYLAEYHFFVWVGYNIRRFDLPIICKLLCAEGIKLTYQPDRWGIVDLYDTVRDFPKPGGVSGGLKYWAKVFGIHNSNEHTGADIASLHAAGEWDKIREYNLSDIRLTAGLYNALRSVYGL